MIFQILLAAVGAVVVEAQCPDGGMSSSGRCWYLGEVGQSCSAVCSSKGLAFNWQVPPEADPMVPKLLGRQPANKQFSWSRLECYVPSADRYHTAKNAADSNSGDSGEPGDWSVDVCRLSCPCGQNDVPALDSTEAYPACVQKDVVLRHAEAHAIFVDLSAVGSAGCWQNDCKHTDKFDVADMGTCARTCAKLPECTHWSFGEQGGVNKCFFRKSDGGRENAEGFYAAIKQCAPPELSDAWMALKASEVLQACDAGKSDVCPDIARAITTWKFAISHLKKAIVGNLDANTQSYLEQIGADTDAYAGQMTEESFPLIVANNRQVFVAMTGWMQSQPRGVADPNDMSLPNPVRGQFCGPNTCYEKI